MQASLLAKFQAIQAILDGGSRAVPPHFAYGSFLKTASITPHSLASGSGGGT